ncbi:MULTISPECIES: AraC family transcriptional regulator [unclassified Shinella]|uniref:helix-turn-helix transcriptional regulator n=1 Tax=unclassified Shinella TaxID=2643062 RepID=UPI00225C6209|nr:MULTISPECIES: AraC family transcriptional regulator [unclassified Shinella]MCO5141381.1 AraC family transcriptional regulator [Shinella sp.]MDC7256756.1 AraC family transcriptional regulator [Shinella sp. YE25]CAI0339638.1 AraC family transcriptional regulator [Rhizobiaceae bacterium]CAK7258032.1 AraC family transcriptional regulator, transcriptional activator of pobA [Shinella sp. WSC3-e]
MAKGRGRKTVPPHSDPDENPEDRTDAVPFRSYALDRSDSPRFHIRLVENTQRLYLAHKHDYFQILYFLSDAPAMRIGLTSHKPKAGSIYFIAPMVPHQIRFDYATRCIVAYFDLDFLRPNITRSYPMAELVRLASELTPFAWQNHVSFDLDAAQSERTERAIASMIEQHRSERIGAMEIVRAELTLMLATLCQDYEAEFAELSRTLPVVGRDSGHMRRIAEFIGENYTRGPSLDEAAAAARLSKSRLCALIRQYTGTSFQVLIREMRIEDARERLVLTDDTIGQIAYRVGYNDEKYFLRAFKSSAGMTPSAYRLKRAKENLAASLPERPFSPQAGTRRSVPTSLDSAARRKP